MKKAFAEVLYINTLDEQFMNIESIVELHGDVAADFEDEIHDYLRETLKEGSFICIVQLDISFVKSKYGSVEDTTATFHLIESEQVELLDLPH